MKMKNLKGIYFLILLIFSLDHVYSNPKKIDFGKVHPIHPFFLLDEENNNYNIDCDERQKCMSRCPMAGKFNFRNHVNYNAPREGCLRECSQILCQKRK